MDVCGGPGGFTEFVFWKRSGSGDFKERFESVGSGDTKRNVGDVAANLNSKGNTSNNIKETKGWGITLKGDMAFKLTDMIVPPGDRFKTIYGVDDTGDVYSLANINAFCNTVRREAKDGVELTVCDGGFSTVGDELHQEEHIRQLLLSQVLICLKVLKKGGNALFKLFDLLQSPTVELIYILYLHFESIAIIKPITSRPANGERYIVCKTLNRDVTYDLITHLESCLEQLNYLKVSSTPPKSAHATHQPGFISHAEKVSDFPSKAMLLP